MEVRDTPERVWSELAAHFKGPIGGKYYFHLLIDQYSRWPEVEVVESTSFEELRPALDRSFAQLGIPDSVTHDNGPCYNSKAWRKYAKQEGFNLKPCTPEHPASNGIAERFMGVIVKVVHAAIAEGKDPKVEMWKRLRNYRNTPHPSTGKSPAELMMARQLKTRIPTFVSPSSSKVHQEAKRKDREERLARKEEFDKKHKARNQDIKKGDKVLIKQQKTTIKPPYNPKPFTVIDVKGTQVKAERGSEVKLRNKAKMKLLKKRPEYLGRKEEEIESSSDEDDDDINLNRTLRHDSEQLEEQLLPQGEQEDHPKGQEEQEEQLQGQEEQEDPQQGQGEQLQATPPRREQRACRPPKRYEMIPWEVIQEKQKSPQSRKKLQSKAKYRKK